jgi:AraC family transcriptional regulator of adaptative response / methylphosphotriester-DNA alkyltransferase methyltransferase
VERVREYILANLAADLRIGTVAEKFGLNKITLRHVFKKQQHETYREYVERMRMDKALHLLKEGKWVKEVMPATGYRNWSTFDRAFKKRYQHPPAFFKK